MSEEKTIYAKLEEELLNLALTEKQKNKLLKKLQLLRENKLNIMLVGATGCGKSSTINALFNCAELQVEDAQADSKDECKPSNAEAGGALAQEAAAATTKTTEKLFVEVAKVGSKSDPETKDIEKYTIGNLTKRTDVTISAWMKEHGIVDDDRNWNTIAKILQRKRAIYCVAGRLSDRKSSKHRKKNANRTQSESED